MVRSRASLLSGVLVASVLLVGCALNSPRDDRLPDASRLPPNDAAVLPPVANDAGPRPNKPDEVLPSGCTTGMTLPCGPSTAAGICQLGARTCTAGVWSNCRGAVFPGQRLCDSPEDNDCDGQPDNVVDAVCQCAAGSAEPCGAHPGLDGNGICKAGQRPCDVATDRLSSNWALCAGSVGPALADSCAVTGDDSNCNGTPNDACVCVEGVSVTCGIDTGVCQVGQSACVNATRQPCAGAISPSTRDCRSGDDNNCDGTPDNVINQFCTCVVGAREPCGTHTEDGVGLCVAGERTCLAAGGNTTSGFGPCLGSVGPAPRLCTFAGDANCDGAPDNANAACTCSIGAAQACNVPGAFGPCRAGQQTCVGTAGNTGSSFGPCEGTVTPAASDSCVVAGDDANCNGVANNGCACIVSQGNVGCTTAAASRCVSPGVCAACGSNADCSHLPGLGECGAAGCRAPVVADAGP